MLLSVFYPTLSSPQSTLYARKGFARIAHGKDCKLRRTPAASNFSSGAGGAPQRDTPEWALSWRTENHPDRSPAQASQDPAAPRLSSRAESGGGALGLIWKSGRGVPLRGLGEVGFLSGRCASRNRRSPAKPIAVAGLPWLLQLPGAAAAVARSSKYCWLRLEAAPASGCQAHCPR